MKHTHAYIVEPINGRYNNKKNVENQELILNTSIEDHKFVNRSGIIIETPVIKDEYNLQIGNEVIIHHNVFRRYYDIRGNEKNSRNYFEENKYFCFTDQIFLYKKSGKWYAPPGFCFVKPIKSINDLSENKEEPLTGVLKHVGSDLRDFGVEDNDLIGFTPNSEYEFVIENERLYRVPLNSISIKYERKGTEVEYNTAWQ
jgi:hypothetical protein